MMSANIGDKTGKSDRPLDHDSALSKPVDLHTMLGRIETMLKLEFITASNASEGTVTPKPPPSADRLGSRHVEELTRLGEIGFVTGIEAKLSELESADLGSSPFVTAARERIRAFDLRGYMALLKTECEHADE